MGGVVAFETALLLQSQGEEVAFVGLLDTLGPPDPINSMEASLPRRFLHRWRGLAFLGPREKADYMAARLKDFAQRGWRKLRRASPSGHGAPFNWVDMSIDTTGSGVEGTGHYVPKVFDGRLTYFLSEASTEPHDYDWRAGWHRHATRGLEVIKVPGDHASMLLEPAVHVLAAKLKVALVEAQGKAPLGLDGEWRTPRANAQAGQPTVGLAAVESEGEVRDNGEVESAGVRN
jgi:thioesterase domain-containing protein